MKRWLLNTVVKCRKKRTGYGKTGVITECVQKLPEKYRVLFHLYFYEGYKPREMAAFLYPEEPVVEDRLKKGTERLEKIMEFERVAGTGECAYSLQRGNPITLVIMTSFMSVPGWNSGR